LLGGALHPDTLTRLLSWPARSVLVVVTFVSTDGGAKPLRRDGSPLRCRDAARRERQPWPLCISHNEHGAYSVRGVHGQAIYIDPKAEMVIARFASHPVAANGFFDPTSLPAYRALAKHLMANPR
jgi:CubicO group peptidase (beta-lactamase class C family)